MLISVLPDAPVHMLPQATLMAGASMVFTEDFRKAHLATPFDPKIEYTAEELRGIIQRSIDGTRFRLAVQPDMMGSLNGEAIPLNLMYSANYFHFLVEWLPSLLTLFHEKMIGPKSVIVSGHLHPNMWFALQYLIRHLTIPIVQLRANQAVTCETVVMAPPSFHATELISGRVSDSTYNAANVRLVREAYKPLWSDPKAVRPLKLYIKRPSDYRTVANYDETERLALAAGYRVIDAGAYTFQDQVRIFSVASHVLGPTGAWVSNLLFTREDAKVAIFYPETCLAGKTIWQSLGEICGVPVEEVYCPIAKIFEDRPIHSDFTIPLDRFKALLKS